MQNKYSRLYTVKLSGSELERIHYVFTEEQKAHTDNIKNGFTGYEGCLFSAKQILKRINPVIKKADL